MIISNMIINSNQPITMHNFLVIFNNLLGEEPHLETSTDIKMPFWRNIHFLEKLYPDLAIISNSIDLDLEKKICNIKSWIILQ